MLFFMTKATKMKKLSLNLKNIYTQTKFLNFTHNKVINLIKKN